MNTEQLNICRIPIGIDSTDERQQILLNDGFERCACTRCCGRMSSPEQCQRMRIDSAYTAAKANFGANKTNERKLVEDCESFLRKYGRFDWCSEIDNVMQIFFTLCRFSVTDDFEHPLVHARFQKIFL